MKSTVLLTLFVVLGVSIFVPSAWGTPSIELGQIHAGDVDDDNALTNPWQVLSTSEYDTAYPDGADTADGVPGVMCANVMCVNGTESFEIRSNDFRIYGIYNNTNPMSASISSSIAPIMHTDADENGNGSWQATFTNVSPGDYTLTIKGNNASATYSIKVNLDPKIDFISILHDSDPNNDAYTPTSLHNFLFPGVSASSVAGVAATAHDGNDDATNDDNVVSLNPVTDCDNQTCIISNTDVVRVLDKESFLIYGTYYGDSSVTRIQIGDHVIPTNKIKHSDANENTKLKHWVANFTGDLTIDEHDIRVSTSNPKVEYNAKINVNPNPIFQYIVPDDGVDTTTNTPVPFQNDVATSKYTKYDIYGIHNKKTIPTRVYNDPLDFTGNSLCTAVVSDGPCARLQPGQWKIETTGNNKKSEQEWQLFTSGSTTPVDTKTVKIDTDPIIQFATPIPDDNTDPTRFWLLAGSDGLNNATKDNICIATTECIEPDKDDRTTIKSHQFRLYGEYYSDPPSKVTLDDQEFTDIMTGIGDNGCDLDNTTDPPIRFLTTTWCVDIKDHDVSDGDKRITLSTSAKPDVDSALIHLDTRPEITHISYAVIAGGSTTTDVKFDDGPVTVPTTPFTIHGNYYGKLPDQLEISTPGSTPFITQNPEMTETENSLDEWNVKIISPLAPGRYTITVDGVQKFFMFNSNPTFQYVIDMTNADIVPLAFTSDYADGHKWWVPGNANHTEACVTNSGCLELPASRTIDAYHVQVGGSYYSTSNIPRTFTLTDSDGKATSHSFTPSTNATTTTTTNSQTWQVLLADLKSDDYTMTLTTSSGAMVEFQLEINSDPTLLYANSSNPDTTWLMPGVGKQDPGVPCDKNHICEDAGPRSATINSNDLKIVGAWYNEKPSAVRVGQQSCSSSDITTKEGVGVNPKLWECDLIINKAGNNQIIVLYNGQEVDRARIHIDTTPTIDYITDEVADQTVYWFLNSDASADKLKDPNGGIIDCTRNDVTCNNYTRNQVIPSKTFMLSGKYYGTEPARIEIGKRVFQNAGSSNPITPIPGQGQWVLDTTSGANDIKNGINRISLFNEVSREAIATKSINIDTIPTLEYIESDDIRWLFPGVDRDDRTQYCSEEIQCLSTRNMIKTDIFTIYGKAFDEIKPDRIQLGERVYSFNDIRLNDEKNLWYVETVSTADGMHDVQIFTEDSADPAVTRPIIVNTVPLIESISNSDTAWLFPGVQPGDASIGCENGDNNGYNCIKSDTPPEIHIANITNDVLEITGLYYGSSQPTFASINNNKFYNADDIRLTPSESSWTIYLDDADTFDPGSYTITVRTTDLNATATFTIINTTALPPDSGTVRNIGALVSTSGDLASIAPASDAIDFAVTQFNKYLESEDKGWTLNVAKHDDHSDPEMTLNRVTTLHTQGIKAFVGPTSTAALSKIESYVNNNDMLAISYGSTSPALAKEGDHIFRTVSSDIILAKALAKLLEHDNRDKFVTVHRDGDPWGSAINAELEKLLDNSKVTTIKYKPDTDNYSDVANQISTALRDNPSQNSAVILLAFDEIVDIVDGAARIADFPNARWFANDIFPSNFLDNENRVSFMNDAKYTIGTVSVPDNPTRAAIDQAVDNADIYAYAAYDAVFILGKAIDEAGSAMDVNRLAGFIPTIAASYDDAAVGNISLDNNGDRATADYDLKTVLSGKLVKTAVYTDADGMLDVLVDVDSTRKVGVLVSATGDIATTGAAAQEAIQYATEEFNKYLKSEDKNWSLELVTFDDQTNASRALEGIRSFDESGINAVIGPITSAALAEIEDHVNNNDMLVISYGSTAPTLAKPDDRIFRTVADDSTLADALTKLMVEDRIAYVVTAFRDDEWGRALNNALIQALPDTITHNSMKYDPDTATEAHYNDIADDLATLFHPDTSSAIVLLGFDEMAEIIEAAADNPKLLAAKWYANDIMPAGLTDTDAERMFLNDVSYTIGTPHIPTNTVNMAIDANVQGADLYSYAAYDAVFILGKAIEQVGSASDTAALAAAIPGIARVHMAAVGDTTLNAAGDLAQADQDLRTFNGNNFETTARYTSSDSSLNIITDTSGQGTAYGLLSSIVGDWNGDGNTDVGSVGIQPNGHQLFKLSNILDDNQTSVQFAGALGATFQYMPGTLEAIVGDWDGDGDTDVGAVGINIDTSQLHFTLSANGTDYTTVFSGTLDVKPEKYRAGSLTHVVGDWDGDGDDDIGFVGASLGGVYEYTTYHIDNGDAVRINSASLTNMYTKYLPGTVEPIVGDWNGDGTDEIGFTGIGGPTHDKPSLRQFVLYVNGELVFNQYTGDYRFYTPGTFTYLVGDWDGDGDDDFGTVGLNRGLQYFTLTTDLDDFKVFFVSAVGESRFYLPGKLVTLVGDWDGDGDADIGSAGIDSNGLLHFLLSPYNADTGFNIQFRGILADAKDYLVPRALSYEIMVINNIEGQPLTPPILVAHNPDISVFTEGQRASQLMRGLAENGHVDPLVMHLAGSDDVTTATSGTAPLSSNTNAATITLTTDGNHPYLSFASMLICTNDGFVGLDTATLGPSTLYPRIYDAGSETNTEQYMDIPGPCQLLTGVTSGQPGTTTSDPRLAVVEPITTHAGITGIGDLKAGTDGNGWDATSIQVDIKRIN